MFGSVLCVVWENMRFRVARIEHAPLLWLWMTLSTTKMTCTGRGMELRSWKGRNEEREIQRFLTLWDFNAVDRGNQLSWCLVLKIDNSNSNDHVGFDIALKSCVSTLNNNRI